MTAFDTAAYDETLDDIETYLGYLKGNELVFQYLSAVHNKAIASGRPFQTVEGDYTTPCPDAAYAFQPRYVVPVREGGSTQIDFAIEKKILAGASASWHKGATWAAGIAGQARSITAQITAVDVTALEAAVATMSDEVLLPLELLLDSQADLAPQYRMSLPGGTSSVDGDWANLSGLMNGWHGAAADEFRTLYARLGDRIGTYAYFAGTATLEVAAATTIIAAAQHGLLKSTDDLRTTLVAQLTKWCATKHPPADGSKAPLWILDLLPITKVFKGVKLLVKGVSEAKKVFEYLTEAKRTIVSKTATKAIQGEVDGEKKPFKAADADEVLASLTSMLREIYLHDFDEALSDLSPSGTGSLEFLHDVRASGMWTPPSVSDGNVRAGGDPYRG